MQFGFHFMNFAFPGGTTATARVLTETARTVDEIGAKWLTFMDHYFQMEPFGGPNAPMLEGYTTLGYIAARTQKVQLGLMVTGVTYRHPGLLAKIVSTLDVLSEGRAMLGIGAAWYEREHLGLGVPYPSLGERFERLEETLQIAQQMWSDDDGAYTGTHFQLAETINLPQPIRRPPILIGGSGERKTLRLVAKYGDACNFFPLGPDAVAAKLEVLARHCDTEGRDYDSIERTVMAGPDPLADTDAFLAEVERYAALGVDLVQFGISPAQSDPDAFVTEIGERLAPRLADVGN